MAVWKAETAKRALGARFFRMLPEDEQETYLSDAFLELVEQLGGFEVWHGLEVNERSRLQGDSLADLQESFFPDAYKLLSNSERERFDFLPYVGCAAHKILNVMKGGEKGMRKEWEKLGISPVLLPNRDNAAVLEDTVN